MVNLNNGDIDSGSINDDPLIVHTMTDTTAYRTVKVLPDETLADVAARVFGSNSELNRDRVSANNSSIQEGPVSVINAP